MFKYLRGGVEGQEQPPQCSSGGGKEGPQRLAYAFSDGASLTVEVDARIELFNLTVTSPGIKAGIARDLLKAQETSAFGPQGCGINWLAPTGQTHDAARGASETTYGGDRCNCRARIEYKDESAVRLVLSSAC